MNESLISEAIETEGGLASLLSMIMNTPTESAEWDTYLQMLELLAKYNEADGFANVNVSAVTTEATAKALIKAVKGWYEKSKFYRSDTNAEGIASIAKGMILLTTPEVLATVDVDVMAMAFNMDRAELAGRIVTVDQWPATLAGTQAFLLDERFFQVYTEKQEFRSIQNPATLDNVYFLHVWQVLSCSRMVPAIRFSTDETNIGELTQKTVSAVNFGIQYEGDSASLDNVDVIPGTDYDLIPAVTYSDGSTDGRAYFVISASSSTAPADNAVEVAVIKPDTGTYIGAGYHVEAGEHVWKLHVDEDSTYDSLAITCISAANAAKSKTKQFTKES